MKFYFFPSLKLSLIFLMICSGFYPISIAVLARLAPGGGNGTTLKKAGKIVGYENLGQAFSQRKYFWGRPSAVNYNAAGSAGSNKAPSNPEYLASVRDRIDTFLVYHPGIQKSEVPAELVTASGSGLDPDISVKAANVQARRIAAVRNLELKTIFALIKQRTEKPLAGFLGPEKINVLKLNLALDELDSGN